jgi:chemotaxis protein CheX
LRAELINPFFISAAEILSMEAGLKVQRGQLSLTASRWTGHKVTAMVSVIGEVEGTVLIGMSEQTAVNFTSAMLGGKIADFNNIVLSAVAEFGNVVSGRAVAKLETLGYNADISPPTLLYGDACRISTLTLKRLQIPLETDLGMFELSVALRGRK